MARTSMSYKQLFRLVAVCSLLWISLAHAEDKPSEQAASPSRYRLSGALLFVNWDSFQISVVTAIEKIKSMSIGELFRKSHGIFQGSELKGKISIELPNGETKAIFDSGANFDYIEFAAVRYFAIEYTGPPPTWGMVKITCDLTEEDVTSEDDVVCSGSTKYQVRRPADSMSSFNKNKGLADGALLEVVKIFVKKQGYHKLLAPYGAKDIGEVIDYLYTLAKKLPDVSIDDAVSLLEDVTGIFLVGLTLEEIEDPSKPGNYKRVDDAWSISDPGLGGNELYGQLYLLPQARTLRVCDVLAEFMELECPDKLKDLELPIIQGPAFPLFDYSRVHNSINDFSISSGQKLPISAYYKNENEHSYVVFSNLWELDGNTALALDDCISKGNAFGFDLIDWKTSTQRDLSKCCYSAWDRAISLVKEGAVTKEQESNLVEYQLKGVFSFQCDSDGWHGPEYEPFGGFSISAGKRNINQNYKIWQSDANAISLTNGGIYRQPFMVRFQESEHFMDEANNKITLHGHVKEDDPTGDDVIGNYDGQSYEANSLSELKKLEFRQDPEDKVTIELQLIPLTIPEKPTILKDYELSGNFEFSCDNDGVFQNYYEPYGSFSIDIGNRVENQGKEVWHWVPNNGQEIKCGKSVQQSILMDFKEVEDFMSSGNTDSKIILRGKVFELDSPGSDVIGNYDGESYDAYTLAEKKTYTFSQDSDDRVYISLQINEKTSALSKQPTRSTKVVQMNSEIERQIAHKVINAIFPLNKGPGDDLATDKTQQEL